MPSQGTSTEPPLTNGHMPTSTSASLSSTTSAPVEVEATIARLSAHRNVRGVMILSREGPIIRNSGAVFDGEAGKKYALVVKKIVDSCRAGIEEIGDGDEVRFLRLRTKKHEIMVTPDERYILIVLQDPGQ